MMTDELRLRNARKLGGCAPAFIRHVLQTCDRVPFPVLVTSGLRTWEEQDALYARGRTAPPLGKEHQVTKARGGYSWHNFGLAADLVPLGDDGRPRWDDTALAWDLIGREGEAAGLEWGGRWPEFPDRPHLQGRGTLTLERARALYKASGYDAVWAAAEVRSA